MTITQATPTTQTTPIITRDAEGRIVYDRAENGYEEWTTYDSAGRVTRWYTSTGHEERTAYDDEGRVVYYRGGTGGETWYAYSRAGDRYVYHYENVEALGAEAGVAGDLEMMRLCRVALDLDHTATQEERNAAWAECARARMAAVAASPRFVSTED